MYEKELLPDCIAIGIYPDLFWTLNPRTLKPFFDGHHKKLLMQDVQAYYSGIYTHEAVSVALANAFRKKGKKPIPYREKPIMQEYEERERAKHPLTDEEKKLQTDMLFSKLGMMQQKFENYNKEKENEAISS